MASVVIDTIAPELHLALGLDFDPTLAVAGDAVVSHMGELAALGHSDASVPISVDHIGDDVQRLTALDIESRGCRWRGIGGRESTGGPRVSPDNTSQEKPSWNCAPRREAGKKR